MCTPGPCVQVEPGTRGFHRVRRQAGALWPGPGRFRTFPGTAGSGPGEPGPVKTPGLKSLQLSCSSLSFSFEPLDLGMLIQSLRPIGLCSPVQILDFDPAADTAVVALVLIDQWTLCSQDGVTTGA